MPLILAKQDMVTIPALEQDVVLGIVVLGVTLGVHLQVPGHPRTMFLGEDHFPRRGTPGRHPGRHTVVPLRWRFSHHIFTTLTLRGNEGNPATRGMEKGK